MTAEYAAWIDASNFCVLTTVGPQGTDGSPRGDAGPVVRIVGNKTLWMPDWRGNNRLDSLRNIVEDGRVSLMFMVPGQTNVIRVNGKAVLTDEPEIVQSFDQKGKHPSSVIIVTIAEIYSQCARALIRSGLWNGAAEVNLPSMGEILRAQTSGDVDGKAYDETWASRAEKTMW